VAVNADELLDIFLRALDNTVVTQQVPVKRSEQSFQVQQGVESITIVVEKNGDENIKFKGGKQRVFGKEQASTTQQWQSSSTHEVITITNPTPGTWALISDTATLVRINVEGQLQILLQQSHQNIKVGQRSYIDVQLANAQGSLLAAEQLKGFNLEVTMTHANEVVFKQQQAFLLDVKTRMHLPVLNNVGMYGLTISVTNGQIMRTITRSLRVHPLVAAVTASQNTISMPAAQEVAVITEVASSIASEIEVLVVSNETASPALQALMEEQSATFIAADIAPKTAASQISNLVEKLKNKLISPAKISPEKTPAMSTAVVKENTNNTQDSQAEALQSTYWWWLIVGGAGLVLLLLLFILRRTSNQADKL
jgi:hypothetical protein